MFQTLDCGSKDDCRSLFIQHMLNQIKETVRLQTLQSPNHHIKENAMWPLEVIIAMNEEAHQKYLRKKAEEEAAEQKADRIIQMQNVPPTRKAATA